MEPPVQQPTEAQSSLETMSSSQTQETSATPSATSATQSSATTSSESTTTTSTQQQVPKGKTLVPGFGLVMSLEILNAPAMQQEQTLNTLLEYQQELPYELRGNQDLLLEFITDNDVGITFDRDTRARWNSLLRYNEVQPSY
jgi:hypothetical protein